MPSNVEDTKVLSSVPESIAEVEVLAEDLRTRLNISEEIYGNILISLTEAANNAIIHGNQCDPSKTISIRYLYQPETRLLSFRVKDQGPGFDYNNLPDPTAPENIDKISGRGVFLMKQLADLIVFEDNGCTIELQFKL